MSPLGLVSLPLAAISLPGEVAAEPLEAFSVAAIDGGGGVQIDACDDGHGLARLHSILLDEAERGVSCAVASEVDAAGGSGVALGESELVGPGVGEGALHLGVETPAGLGEGGGDTLRRTTRDVGDLLGRWLGELDELEAAVAALDVRAVEEERMVVDVEPERGIEALDERDARRIAPQGCKRRPDWVPFAPVSPGPR